jgi:DNA-binding MarR family transcriptional regulator
VNPQVRWLTAEQERLWRRWLTLNAQLAATLHKELHHDAGLSMPDYEVLVHLTDNAEGRIRVTDLALLLQWERSRLSHHVTRMEQRRLVQRVECAEDGRGAFIVITPQGRSAIEQAAPHHVNTVRHLIFDALTPDEVDAFATIIDKALAQLEKQSPAPHSDRQTPAPWLRGETAQPLR